MSEEQQAANKAANKKAKKLKQKLNKQQAQHAATNRSTIDLPVNGVTCSSDTASDASALEHRQQDSSLQPASAGLSVSAAPGTGSTAGNKVGSSASSTAGGIANVSRQGPALPVSTAQPVAADAESQVSKQAPLHTKHSERSVDDDSFLQELFRCPITQVSLPKHQKKALSSDAPTASCFLHATY